MVCLSTVFWSLLIIICGNLSKSDIFLLQIAVVCTCTQERVISLGKSKQRETLKMVVKVQCRVSAFTFTTDFWLVLCMHGCLLSIIMLHEQQSSCQSLQSINAC